MVLTGQRDRSVSMRGAVEGKIIMTGLWSWTIIANWWDYSTTPFTQDLDRYRLQADVGADKKWVLSA